jgi:hypothetical protein
MERGQYLPPQSRLWKNGSHLDEARARLGRARWKNRSIRIPSTAHVAALSKSKTIVPPAGGPMEAAVAGEFLLAWRSDGSAEGLTAIIAGVGGVPMSREPRRSKKLNDEAAN